MSSLLELQNSLDSIADWAATWQLKLSPSKCTVLRIGQTNNCPNYTVDVVKLPNVDQMTDLGVQIDHTLHFSSHINTVCIRAKQRASLILKCFHTREPAI
jgi:hypothetical protein